MNLTFAPIITSLDDSQSAGSDQIRPRLKEHEHFRDRFDSDGVRHVAPTKEAFRGVFQIIDFLMHALNVCVRPRLPRPHLEQWFVWQSCLAFKSLRVSVGS